MEYEADVEYLQLTREQFDHSEETMKNDLLGKGVPRSLTDAVVQKIKDFHNARHRYLTMREEFRERDNRVRRRAGAAGLNLTRPQDGVYHSDLSSIQQRKLHMDQLTSQIVQWMHTAGVDPYLRLTIHQTILDADIGRCEELQLVEDLKKQLSIITIWEQELD